MRDQLYKVQDAKDEIQIIVDERDRTIRILNDTLSGKSSELSRLADENINFREAISKCKHLIKTENQNERFKEKIDEMNHIHDDKEDEINRLIELLKDHESQDQSDNGKYYYLIPIRFRSRTHQIPK
jgi:septal ring factor EnvC (AmiA/AmiB activator)